MAKDYSRINKDQLIQIVKELELKKSFGLVWEEQIEKIVDQCKKEVPILVEDYKKNLQLDPYLPNNIIIEGDNYHSLSVLNYTHKKGIDLIYIDPPYNTGAKNWKYNNNYVDKDDSYRHSRWLSLMSRRLKLAKKLLNEEGSLICAIDENEQAHLEVLLEEIFNNFNRHTITIVHNPKGVQGKNFSYIHEYAIFVLPKNRKSIVRRKLEKDEIYISNLRNWGGESLRNTAKNCFYPIIVRDKKIIGFGPVAKDSYHPKNANQKKNGEIYVWPVDSRGVERKWRYARQSIEDILKDLIVKKSSQGTQILIAKQYGTYKTVWFDKKYDASEYGTKLLRKILPGCDFDFPKSLHTVYDCIHAVVGNKKEATILDFFAGSGTTGHAVLELNKRDKGSRRFILCTNNENDIAKKVTYPRIKKVIKGYSNVDGISANLRYYKTAFVDIGSVYNVSDEKKIELTYEAGRMIALRENTLDEQEKNDWWQIFTNGKGKITAVYFKEDKGKLNELVKKIKDSGLATLYVFSWGKNEYKNEFTEYRNIKVEDIPEPILEVYKEINKK